MPSYVLLLFVKYFICVFLLPIRAFAANFYQLVDGWISVLGYNPKGYAWLLVFFCILNSSDTLYYLFQWVVFLRKQFSDLSLANILWQLSKQDPVLTVSSSIWLSQSEKAQSLLELSFLFLPSYIIILLRACDFIRLIIHYMPLAQVFSTPIILSLLFSVIALVLHALI